MVVFTCSQCGQSLKKNQVENHCNYQCHGCQSVSCMDCGKVFWGDDYKGHTKCITENQKYGGKDYQPKPSSNKGEVKQEKWIEHIKKTLATRKLSGPLANVLEQMVQFSNIPRKKSKFENFLKNSLKLKNPQLINEAWEIFDQSASSNEPDSTSPQSSAAVGGTNDGVKRPLDDKVEPENKKICVNGNNPSNDSVQNTWHDFNWEEAMEKRLMNIAHLPISILRKMVLAEYRATFTDSKESDDDLKKMFNNVLTRSDLFIVNKPQ